MNPNFRSNCGSLMILARNDSRPFAMTWITVCIHEKIQQEITPFAMFVWIESVDPCNATHTRLTEARLQLIFKQRAKHDVNIDVSFFSMAKCAGQSADYFETKLIPEMDRSGVSGDHEIELHRAKGHSARLAQTVLGHSAAHSGAFGVSCHHESGIGDVRPGPRLIRSQNVSADNAAIFFCDVGVVS